jgi:hypothetical protein
MYGKVWRTSADEATTFVTDRTLAFGMTEVPAGTYTLYTLPGENEWMLIINKQTRQWGTQYTMEQDLSRVAMKPSQTSAPVEQLTISIASTNAGGTLLFEWSDMSVAADFTVK